MSRQGWVKLHRKLRDHPRAGDPDWVAVWHWMLLEAAYEPRRVLFSGQVVVLKPGQFTAGRHQIAKATGVSESKVRRVIDAMKTDQQIDQRTSNAYSLYSIINWESYQGLDQPNGQPAASQRPASGHT